MVRRAIDGRRRAILRAVAAGFVGSGRSTTRSRSTVDRGDRPMTGPAADPPQAEFLVHGGEGTTVLSRRGEAETMFRGPAGTALQRAVDAGEAAGTGALIAVSSGTYELERPVTLASSTWLAGSGVATTLRAGDGLDAPLLTVPAGAEHGRVSDLRLEGNGAGNDRGDGLVVVGGAWRPVFEHLVVRGTDGHGIRFTDGPDGAYVYEPVLSDVDVARCAGDGFVFGYTGDLFGVNLYAEACEGYGFTLADAGGTLVHPHAYDTRGEAGIRVLESGKDLTLFGAHTERNRQHGLLVEGERITIRNAFVANNSRDAPDAYSGLVLDGARDSMVSESAFLNDTEQGRTQRHGVVETAASRENVVSGNLFRENASSAVKRPSNSTGTQYRNNRGYQTANGGEATVRDGDPIPHGLNERPQQYWVESTSSGTYAHVVDVNDVALIVEVLRAGTGDSLGRPVDVTWGAIAR